LKDAFGFKGLTASAQASAHTPFYLPPLKDAFGFKGLTASAQATLAGLYESDYDLDSRILDVILQWQMPQKVRNLGTIKMELMTDAHISFWKKAREDTSCYPSVLSFSTMKAGASDSEIAALDCSLTRIPLCFGFAPTLEVLFRCYAPKKIRCDRPLRPQNHCTISSRLQLRIQTYLVENDADSGTYQVISARAVW